MDSPEQSLFAFEQSVDQELASLQLWSLPLRSLLSAMFLMVNGLITRGDVERAGSLVSQISLLSAFFRNSSLEIGISAEDALSVIGQQEFELLRQVVVYARFCELMPEVHRGHYGVGSSVDGFQLNYGEPSQSAEEYDFTLHEVAKATDASSLETRSPLFSQLIRDWPTWDVRLVHAVLSQLYTHHLQTIYERPLLRSEAHAAAFGLIVPQGVV
jgi:hypothetical protein